MNSCRKGKVGEREAAHELRRVLGVEARRGCQYQGGPDSPDVVGLPGCHVEVKRTQRLNLGAALAQAIRDAGPAVLLVLHRSNRSPWLVSVRLDDLPQLAAVVAQLATRATVDSPAVDGPGAANKPLGPSGRSQPVPTWTPAAGN